MELNGGSVPQTLAEAKLKESSPSPGGFCFNNVARNRLIEESAGTAGKQTLPKAKLTGTTICGCLFKDGVVLGADTRATSGSEVADKNCQKIHYIAPNIYCCGAGTAADTDKTTELISSKLDLLRLNTGAQSRVIAACTLLKDMLFRYQGHIGAALVLGGVDCTGPSLYMIYPHGSCDKLPYATMGSGSLAAMSVLETQFKENMEEAEAVKLVKECILAGVLNDLGSGSNVDVTVIRSNGVSVQRNVETPYKKDDLRAGIVRPPAAVVPKGATKVLKEVFEKFIEVETGPEPMTI